MNVDIDLQVSKETIDYFAIGTPIKYTIYSYGKAILPPTKWDLFIII